MNLVPPKLLINNSPPITTFEFRLPVGGASEEAGPILQQWGAGQTAVVSSFTAGTTMKTPAAGPSSPAEEQ